MKKIGKRGIQAIFLCLLVLLIVVIGRFNKQKVPSEAKALYSTYMQTIQYDYGKAANEYCHFEMPVIKELTEESDDFVTSYNILNWERINDELWVVETSFRTLSIPDGDTMFNFVGKIDGKYYVMINAYQVPTQLHKNFNPLHYIPPNAVPYQNVVGLLD